MLFLEYVSVYVFGGIAYGSIEILWRGETHWTMLLTGGFCCCMIYLISNSMKLSRIKTWLLCAAVITAVEFVVGCLVNIRLGWRVWDYSRQYLSLMGQICPLYTFFWFLLSVPGSMIAKFLRKRVFVRNQ